MPVNVPSTDSKYPHTPREVRAQVAASLAGYYSELSGLDEPAEPFSLGRFLRRLAEGMRLDGHENAVVEATRLIAGPQGDYSSFWLPFSVLSTRAMTSVPGPKGGYLTAPQTLGAVDVLRPASAAISAGMQVLENVTDGVVLPRVATDIALTWISENGPPQTESPIEQPREERRAIEVSDATTALREIGVVAEATRRMLMRSDDPVFSDDALDLARLVVRVGSR